MILVQLDSTTIFLPWFRLLPWDERYAKTLSPIYVLRVPLSTAKPVEMVMN